MKVGTCLLVLATLGASLAVPSSATSVPEAQPTNVVSPDGHEVINLQPIADGTPRYLIKLDSFEAIPDKHAGVPFPSESYGLPDGTTLTPYVLSGPPLTRHLRMCWLPLRLGLRSRQLAMERFDMTP